MRQCKQTRGLVVLIQLHHVNQTKLHAVLLFFPSHANLHFHGGSKPSAFYGNPGSVRRHEDSGVPFKRLAQKTLRIHLPGF